MSFVESGIAEFDRILGGFLKGQTVLLAGNPGSGKTTFATQFLYNGLTNGEAALYVGMVETKEDYFKYMQMAGFDLERHERESRFIFFEVPTFTESEGVEVLVKNLLRMIKDYGVSRVAIDSITALESAISDGQVRAFLHNALLRGLKASGVTSILIADLPFNAVTIGYGVEEFVFDAVLSLELGLKKGVPRRSLIVKKMRGVFLLFTHFDIVLGKRGIALVAPYALEIGGNIGERSLKFSVEELNESISGGIREGTTTVLAGPSGSGKTLLSLDLARQCSKQGKQCLFISLEESIPQITGHLERMGATTDEISSITCLSHA